MIWFSIVLSDGYQIASYTMKHLYYQMLEHMRNYVGNTDKGDYKSIYGTFKQHTFLNGSVWDKDIGFTMMTSCSFTVIYYGSMNHTTIKRGVLK